MKSKTPPRPNLISVVSTATPAATVRSRYTFGLDSGDVHHYVCVLSSAGAIVREGSIVNSRPALSRLMQDYAGATVTMEVELDVSRA